MSIIWRSWLSILAILSFVLCTMVVLISLQHDAVLASLVKQRLSVVAQSSANHFQPAVDIGLPLAMLRNAQALLERARGSDRHAPHVWLLDAVGQPLVSVHAGDEPVESLAEVMAEVSVQPPDGSQTGWQHETDGFLISGIRLFAPDNELAGTVVAAYSKQRFNTISQSLAVSLTAGAGVIGCIMALLSWLLLSWKLRDAAQGYRHILALLQQFAHLATDAPFPVLSVPKRPGFFSAVIPIIHRHLVSAERHIRADDIRLPTRPVDHGVLKVQPGYRSLAAGMARHLSLWIVAVLLTAVLLFSVFAYQQTRQSFEPEQVARLELIGMTVNADIQRALSAGIPLNDLVGAERYFNRLLSEFPEVSYFAISRNADPSELSSAGQYAQVPASAQSTFPLTFDGREVGRIVVSANTRYFALRFRDVLLDLIVVVLVSTLLALQVLVVVFSTMLTEPFNRLEHLLSHQARGDFSVKLNETRRSEIDRAARFLSERSEHLAFKAGTPAPRTLQFAYLNDIRLPVFLVACVDALSVSFLPVYAGTLPNPLATLNQAVVISLPLAGYLLAIMLTAPLARPLAGRFGHKSLLVGSCVLGGLWYIGLWQSSTTVELILFRTLAGATFALATLGCQDYVLAIASRQHRHRGLGLFTSTLFSGVFAGAATGGVLADRFGAADVFGLGAVLLGLAACTALLLLPRQRPERQSLCANLRVWRPLTNRRFMLLVTCVAIPSNVQIQVFIAFLLALLLHDLGASAADIGRALMLFYLSLMVCSALLPRVLAAVMTDWAKVLTGLLLSAASLAAVAIWPVYWTAFCAAGVAGLGQALLRDPLVSIALSLADKALSQDGTDTVLNSLRSAERLGSLCGLLLIALLSSYHGYTVGIAVVSLWLLTGAFGWLVCRSWEDG